MTSGKGEPHPLRCETCNHKSDIEKYGDMAKMCACTKLKRNITWQQWCIIRDAGCASHSGAAKAEQRIADAIGILEMQIGCSMMLDDDGDSELAYTQLRDECKKAISLLKGDGGK